MHYTFQGQKLDKDRYNIRLVFMEWSFAMFKMSLNSKTVTYAYPRECLNLTSQYQSVFYFYVSLCIDLLLVHNLTYVLHIYSSLRF